MDETDVLDYTPVELSRDDLLLALRHDCVAFLGFYIGDSLTLDVPQLHIDIWDQLLEMVDQCNQPGTIQSLRKLFAVPREHAKSTLAKLAVILFIKYTKLRFVLYVSKTNSIAKNAIRDIAMWLSSAQERDLFGPIGVIKSSETESLWIYNVATRFTSAGGPIYKKIIFKALGADQQVRGLLIDNLRPQIIVIDDIEDLDNTTSDQQPKLDEWFLGSLLKSFAKSNIVLYIGNMIRKTTLLARLARSPEWNPTVYGSLVHDSETGELRPLWPGRWTVEALLKEYKEYRRLGRGYVWEAEMMNLTQDEILQGNLDNAIRLPQPTADQLEAGFITVDPAFGKESYNDDTGLTVHARIRGVGIPCVIESVAGRWTEDQIFDQLLELSYKWGISTWCIEAEAAQRILIPYFQLLLQSRGMNLNLFVMIPMYSGGVNKGARILTFRNSVASANYGVCESEEILLDRLMEYSPDSKKHDDRCDSAAYGPIAWQYHNSTIEAQGVKQVALLAYGNGGPVAEIQQLGF